MVPFSVVMGDVLRHRAPEVLLPDRNQPVQAFFFERPHENVPRRRWGEQSIAPPASGEAQTFYVTTTNPRTAATVMRSLWQHNEVGYKVERFVNWQAVTGSVRYLTVV